MPDTDLPRKPIHDPPISLERLRLVSPILQCPDSGFQSLDHEQTGCDIRTDPAKRNIRSQGSIPIITMAHKQLLNPFFSYLVPNLDLTLFCLKIRIG